MMHDGVLMAIGNTCQLLVPFANRTKTFVDACSRQSNVPLLPELLCALHAFEMQAKSFGVFLLVKHWHFLPAAPAPEHLHLRSILPEQKRLQEQPLPLQPLIDRLAVHR